MKSFIRRRSRTTGSGSDGRRAVLSRLRSDSREAAARLAAGLLGIRIGVVAEERALGRRVSARVTPLVDAIRKQIGTRRPHLRIVLALSLLAATISGGRFVSRVEPPLAETGGQTPIALMDDAESNRHLSLAPATTVPTAASNALKNKGPLQENEVFAFAPYWTLDGPGTDVHKITTLAYFGVDVAENGGIIRDGNGWVGYNSQELVNTINRAHKAGARVVLVAKSFEGSTLRSLAANPKAGERLGRELAALVKAKNFDGVNLDFEGFGGGLRDRFTTFIGDVSRTLHAVNKDWQVTIDTYIGSAEVDDGFFDIAGLAKHVDAIFVMGYDMYATGYASPNAPLPRYESAIAAYVKQAPGNKIILGMPFYGYDWPTESNAPRSKAVGESTPVTYSDILAAGHPRYWDQAASVPWTAYKVDGQWHEIYYDDPSSLALKADLVRRSKLRGVGAWALGMDHNDRNLLGALSGVIRSVLRGPAGPALATSDPKPTTSGNSAPQPTPASKPKPKPKPSGSPSPSPSPTASLPPLPI